MTLITALLATSAFAGPDLRIDDVDMHYIETIDRLEIEVVVKNVGDAPAAASWVDLYADGDGDWGTCDARADWVHIEALDAGEAEVVTLAMGGLGLSFGGSGLPLYVMVDSLNHVDEVNEKDNQGALYALDQSDTEPRIVTTRFSLEWEECALEKAGDVGVQAIRRTDNFFAKVREL